MIKYCRIILMLTIILLSFPVSVNKSVVDNHKIDMNYKNIIFGSDNITLSKLNKNLFSNDEYSYNHELAIESLMMATSAFSANVNNSNWGNNEDVNRDKNIKDYFSSHGFADIRTYGYDISLNDFSSKAAFAVAKKTLNSNTNIIAIAIRGGNYGLEWADNFNMGLSGESHHIGFYRAALDIKEKIYKVISYYDDNSESIFWISGYSRGGAVANILASMINDDKALLNCRIYAYTFASPKTVISKSEDSHDKKYRNIFNIISPNDPVYNIPPSKWGFARYGVSYVLPNYEKNDTIDEKKLVDNVAATFKEITGENLIIYSNALNSFMDVIIKSAKDRDFFAENLSMPISDLIKIKMLKFKNENSKWVSYTADDALEAIHGNKAVDILYKVKNNEVFVYLSKLGIPIPEELYVFAALCYINGFNNFDAFFFSDLNADELSKLVFISSSEIISAGHRSEFYLSWLKNITADNFTVLYE